MQNFIFLVEFFLRQKQRNIEGKRVFQGVNVCEMSGDNCELQTSDVML